jgi:hypothetical protein
MSDRRSPWFYPLIVLGGVIFGFGLLTFAPEHPATTVAKLAVDSPTTTTTLHVAAYAVGAAVLFVGARRLVGRTDPEGL